MKDFVNRIKNGQTTKVIKILTGPLLSRKVAKFPVKLKLNVLSSILKKRKKITTYKRYLLLNLDRHI